MTFAARYRVYYAGGTLLLLSSILSYYFLVTYPASQRTETVFVYATLTNPLIRTYACRCFVGSQPSTLSGYYRDGRTIIASNTATVNGVIITVSPAELARLDRYEGVPIDYQRESLLVNDVPVFVYIKNPSRSQQSDLSH